MSPEVYRYAEKLSDYQIIQQIERQISSHAVDSPFNILQDEGGLQGVAKSVIPPPQKQLLDATLDTFFTTEQMEEEISRCLVAIKQAFHRQPVWTYKSLLQAVRDTPGNVNMRMILEDNFIIALHQLIARGSSVGSQKSPLAKLLDSSERFIYPHGIKSQVSVFGEYYILFPMEGDHPLRDVEMYMRKQIPEPDLRVPLREYMSSARVSIVFQQKKDMFMSQVERSDNTEESLIDIFFKFSDRFQVEFVEKAIEQQTVSTATAKNVVENIMTRVIAMMSKFNAIITKKEVSKYRNITSKYKLPDVSYIGYTAGNNLRLLTKAGWLDINPAEMNRQELARDNDIIVGYFETVGESSKFKLRAPHRENNVQDARLLERGIVCSTKSKEELVILCRQLGISISELKKSEIRVKNLCKLLKHKLIQREWKERKNRTIKRYISGWW